MRVSRRAIHCLNLLMWCALGLFTEALDFRRDVNGGVACRVVMILCTALIVVLTSGFLPRKLVPIFDNLRVQGLLLRIVSG